MKPINTYLLYICLIIPILFVLGACQKTEGYNTPASSDLTKPGMVTNIKVDNFNGGANITYTLPNSKNLLYVMAQYKINDKVARETKSSYYSDTITVEGFAKKAAYEVTLYAVSRANVKSDPVIVKVNPDTPPYLLLKPTVTVQASFGGLKVLGNNPLKKSLGIVMLKVDQTNFSDIVDQYYSNKDSISYSLRGFPPVAQKFGYYVTDSYGNISDTTYLSATPFFETVLDKNKFFVYNLPTDSRIGYGWDLPNLWNGKTDGNGWHSSPDGSLPVIATFGLGITAKLSRFVMWERPDGDDRFAFGHGNPKLFSLWGSDKAQPADIPLPRTAPAGTVLGDWTNLGNFNFPDPPSGLKPAAHNASDNDFVKAGVNFDVPLASPKVRYLRLSVGTTWSNGSFAHVMEMTFYGDTR